MALSPLTDSESCTAPGSWFQARPGRATSAIGVPLGWVAASAGSCHIARTGASRVPSCTSSERTAPTDTLPKPPWLKRAGARVSTDSPRTGSAALSPMATRPVRSDRLPPLPLAAEKPRRSPCSTRVAWSAGVLASSVRAMLPAAAALALPAVLTEPPPETSTTEPWPSVTPAPRALKLPPVVAVVARGPSSAWLTQAPARPTCTPSATDTLPWRLRSSTAPLTACTSAPSATWPATERSTRRPSSPRASTGRSLPLAGATRTSPSAATAMVPKPLPLRRSIEMPEVPRSEASSGCSQKSVASSGPPRLMLRWSSTALA